MTQKKIIKNFLSLQRTVIQSKSMSELWALKTDLAKTCIKLHVNILYIYIPSVILND